jgi:hypothetical protein
LAASKLRNIAAALLLVAGKKNVVGTERIVRRDDDADGSIDGGELFDSHHVIGVAKAGTTVLFRKDDAHQPHFAELLDDGRGKFADLVPLHDVRRNFAGGKLADDIAQLFLITGELEGVRCSGSGGIKGT